MSMVSLESPLLGEVFGPRLPEWRKDRQTPPRWRGSRAGGPDKKGRGSRKSIVKRFRVWLGRNAVPVEHGSSLAIESQASGAAIPSLEFVRGKETLTLRFDVPGATPRSTRVSWDERARQLTIAVWHQWSSRELQVSGSELLWYRSCWLPNGDGNSATASVHKGLLEVVVPTEPAREVA